MWESIAIKVIFKKARAGEGYRRVENTTNST
jgi:hypothetical protein